MKKNKLDYIKFLNMPLYQDDKMFCINTDTSILGMSFNFKENLTVLDIGTNNGALLLYASRFKPALLCGVEIDLEASLLAKENLNLNNLKGDIYHSKIQDFKHDPFDIIICNPPFFKENNQRKNSDKNRAMFSDRLSLEDLFISFKRLLKDNGKIFLIYDAEQIGELFIYAYRYGFKIMTLQNVFDENRPLAKRILLKLKRGSFTKTKILKPIIISKGEIKL